MWATSFLCRFFWTPTFSLWCHHLSPPEEMHIKQNVWFYHVSPVRGSTSFLSTLQHFVDTMGFGTVRGHLGGREQRHPSTRLPGRESGPLRIPKSVGGWQYICGGYPFCNHRLGRSISRVLDHARCWLFLALAKLAAFYSCSLLPRHPSPRLPGREFDASFAIHFVAVFVIESVGCVDRLVNPICIPTMS